MTHTRWAVVGLSVASIVHALVMAPSWDGESAAQWQTVLYGVANGHGLTSPLAAWQSPFFATRGPAGAALALAPFHLLAAWGLWRIGLVRGGTWGGAIASVLGLASPAMTLAAAQGLPSFAAAGCGVALAATVLARERGEGGGAEWSRSQVVGTGIGGVALALALVSSFGAPPATMALRDVIAPLGAAILLGTIASLLLAAEGWRGVVAVCALAPNCLWLGGPFSLLFVPAFACVATHRHMAAGAGRVVSVMLAVAALAQFGGQHSVLTHWPAPAASLRPVPSPAFDFSGVTAWLAERPDARVAIYVPPTGPLHVADFTRAVAQSGFAPATNGARRPTVIGPTYAGGDDVGIVVTLAGTVDPLAAWLPLLPLPATVLTWPGGYTVSLYDHGLPGVVSGGTVPPQGGLPTPASEHPANQSLYVLTPDGTEHGPLLTPCSSPDVVHLPDGWHVYFVQNQEIYHATGDDGLHWNTPSPLGIRAVDPAIVREDGGETMLAAVPDDSAPGADPNADPAGTLNDIALFVRGVDGAFERDEKTWLGGVGVVDPIAVLGARREIYFTEGRDHIARAIAATLPPFERDPTFRMDGTTVPALTPDGSWLVGQRHVAASTVLYAFPRVGDGYGKAQPLEVCGTGAAIEGDRVYYTRAPDAPCGADVVDRARRRGAPWSKVRVAP